MPDWLKDAEVKEEPKAKPKVKPKPTPKKPTPGERAQAASSRSEKLAGALYKKG